MIIANFINKQDALVTGLDQYDYGQILRIQGLKLPTAVEIHFGLEETGGTTTTRIGVTKDGVTDVPIPDYMLENGDTSLDYTIYAFIYLTDDTSGKTVHRIRMQVKARSKPELLNKPEDKELFQKAIEAVNQSAKEAEGWAHGREDMPERATDNAKYYAGESAKSAESVKGVEQNVKDMVATIGEIEQQVQDVKEYAGQAKTAAENALLSEQEAKKSEETSLQHRTGAETAENNAELAESNAKKSEQVVEQAKQLVMQMGQEVLNNKNQVDEKVEAFNKVVADASDAIKTAKTDAVDAVETAGTEQAKKVADEGAKQVKAVEDKGNEVLQSIPKDFTTQMASKLDKNQGVENKGKALVVGEDGNVAVGEVQSGGNSDVIKALQDALISQVVSGDSIKVTDSSRLPVEKFTMSGKTEQVQTTGKNLFDEKKLLNLDDPNYDKSQSGKGIFYYKFKIDEQVTVSVTKLNKDGEYLSVGTEKNAADAHWLSHKSAATNTFKTLTPKDGYIYLGVNTTLERIENMIRKTGGIMINHGSVAMPYEPYTGGKPSPSPDYSQPIEVTPQGVITVDFTDGTNHQIVELNCPREFTKWDRLEKIDGVWNWVFQSKRSVLNEKLVWDTGGKEQIDKGNYYFVTVINDASGENQTSVCKTFKNVNFTYGSGNIGTYGTYCDHVNLGAGHKFFRQPNESIRTLDEWKAWLAENPIEILYKTKEPELIPLSLSEQNKLNALTMYAPNTEATNTGGCNMELTYTVDTKSYVDSKILTLSKALL